MVLCLSRELVLGFMATTHPGPQSAALVQCAMLQHNPLPVCLADPGSPAALASSSTNVSQRQVQGKVMDSQGQGTISYGSCLLGERSAPTT